MHSAQIKHNEHNCEYEKIKMCISTGEKYQLTGTSQTNKKIQCEL